MASKQDKCLGIMSSLHGINRALKRRACMEHGNSLGMLIVLQAVAAQGRVRSSELADHLLMDMSSISRRVCDLEARGLVTKVVDDRDRRASWVALTPGGADVLASLRTSAGAALAQVLPRWNAKDLDTLAALLVRLDTDLSSPDTESAKQLTAATK